MAFPHLLSPPQFLFDMVLTRTFYCLISVYNEVASLDNIGQTPRGYRQSGLGSAVWNHASRLSKTQAQCNYCAKIYTTINGNTTGMRLHIMRDHGIERKDC